MFSRFIVKSRDDSYKVRILNICPNVVPLTGMDSVGKTFVLLYLVKVLCISEIVTAEDLSDIINIQISLDSISGDLLLQVQSLETRESNINLYRDIQGFRTNSVRIINTNGMQNSEFGMKAEAAGDAILLERIFTHVLARDCMLRYDGNNDTLNLTVKNTQDIHINYHNGSRLLTSNDTEEPMLMIIWPANTEIFEVDVSINENQ